MHKRGVERRQEIMRDTILKSEMKDLRKMTWKVYENSNALQNSYTLWLWRLEMIQEVLRNILLL